MAAVLLLLFTLTGYARRALFNSDQFANRAAATLKNDSVRNVVAQRVTDELVLKNEADLLAARPLIQSAVAGIVGSSAFRSLFDRSVRDVHRAVFYRDQNTATLALADVGTVAGAALEKLQPTVAAKLEQNRTVTLFQRHLGDGTGGLARWTNRAQILSWLLAGLTLAAMAGAIALSDDRRRTISRLGIAVASVGVLIVIAYAVARAVVLAQLSDPADRAAAAGVWSSFIGDLRTWGWVLAGSGAIVAAAAASLIHPVEIEGALRRAWRLVTVEPERTWLRVGRALGLVAVGALVIAQPLTALQVAATLVGVYLVYLGVEAILRMTYRAPLPGAEPAPEEPPHRWRRRAVPAVAAVLVALALTIFLTSGGASQPAIASTNTCNGYAALCDKTLKDVVLPATHNSMSVPLPGWYSSEQETPIGRQLQDGIRGLLIDTHYGDRLPNGRVRTEINSEADIQERLKQDGISQQAFEAAQRLRNRLGFKGKGKRGMYLCHSFCELGATPLSDGLRAIHDFLVTHPDNVLVVINQDYVTPADFVRAVGAAGLTPYVFKGLDDAHWPTLRQMIDEGQRVVFLAENHAGGAPWYQLAYKRLTEETPYEFRKVPLLTDPQDLAASCQPNRGPANGAPLFLINHWISTDPVPLPTNAAKVNAYGPLLQRARDCERIRHHLPNLLAVNFYREGDLFRVVNTLNGVGSGN